ncbi:MAG TPA: glutamyl-tRNA reductase [Dehalococcoidia bacterium]|nr:glutamyl-tRNA reductase [Dehalococcoidia bacterium]
MANCLQAVGISYRTAPVEERETLAFSAAELVEALGALKQRLGSAVIVSTCNRTELYTTSLEDGHPPEKLAAPLLELKGAKVDPPRLYFLHHEEAVRHLYRVASGIDSMVLGEAQILGQVREALSAATTAGSLNGVLSRLFHTALAVGKRARSETRISSYALSVSGMAVALAQQIFPRLEERTVLIISAGSTGKLAAKALKESGASQLLVVNRTYDKALEMARKLDGTALPQERLLHALAMSDIVISATGSENFIIGPELISAALRARSERSLLLIDIAVPRDVDPHVRQLPGVHLYDIDDLQNVPGAVEGIEERQQEIARVEELIGEEVERFLNWWRSLDVVPVIAALREQAEEIRRQELEKALRRLPGLTQQERESIEAMSQAIINKLFHRPVTRLKEGSDPSRYVETLETLFGLTSTYSGE